MKAHTAVLLLLLLRGGPPGRGQAQNEEDEDGEDLASDGYEDDDEEDLISTDKDQGLLQCNCCPDLQEGEVCDQVHNCCPHQAFCKTVTYRDSIESTSRATHTGWCTDECEPVNKTVGGTWVMVTCCQTPLCNSPPRHTSENQETSGSKAGDLLDSRAGGAKGSPSSVGTTLLLCLLAGPPAVGP